MASGRKARSSRFGHFAAIDWSGAMGERHRGIAVALCRLGKEAPRLIRRDRHWSRADVLSWLLEDMPQDTLVGVDLGTALPFVDHGAYFPTWARSPDDAPSLWALVDAMSAADPHLAAGSFVDEPEVARHFRRHGGRQGDLFAAGRGRLRVTEQVQARMGLNPVSNLNLVGAAQVGKSSLTGMRVLHRLRGAVPVWPFNADQGAGPLLVEIYTSLAAQEAGRRAGRSKMRDAPALDTALAMLGSAPSGLTGMIDDHASDAILTSAWLRVAHARAELWHPRELTEEVRLTEGWTFGAA